MAHKVQTMFVDDLDGGQAAGTVHVHPNGRFLYGANRAQAKIEIEGKKVFKGGENSIVVYSINQSTGEPTPIQHIESGAIHSSILQDSYRAGYESIEVLADEVRGVPHGPAESSPILNVGINVLTAKNLHDLRYSGAIRQPAAAATTKPAAP